MRACALRVIGTFDRPTDQRYHWELIRPDDTHPEGTPLLTSLKRFRDRTSALADFVICRAYMAEADIQIPDVAHPVSGAS